MATSESRVRADLANEGARCVERLSDEPFLRAACAYGGELRLHFGKPGRYDSPRLAGRTRGAWVLSLRATPWVLVSHGVILSRSHDEQQHALRHFAELERTRLVDARLRRNDAAVTLRLGEASWFMALTEPRRDLKNLDLWELLTPEGRFVVARGDRSIAVQDASAGVTVDLGE